MRDDGQHTEPTRRLAGRAWMRLRAVVLRSNPLCVVCQAAGRLRAATQVDHVRALFQGGTNDFDNLQGLCEPCHLDKSLAERGYRQRQAIGIDGYPLETDQNGL